jgi:hypothetical protein
MEVVNCILDKPYLFDSLTNPHEYMVDVHGCIKRTFLNENLNVINHKYFYYSLGSTINYLKAIYLPSFKEKYLAEQEAEVTIFLKWCDETNFFKDGISYDYFSLGCGDGEKDKKILENIESKAKTEINYFPIDFSYFLLKMAIGKIKNLRKNIHIFPFNIDFNNIEPNYVHAIKNLHSSQRTAVFALLGNTIGNYDEKQLLMEISSIMRPKDYLLIGHRIITNENVNDIKNEGDTDFLLQPLHYFGISQKYDLDGENLKLEVIDNSDVSKIHGSKSVIFKFDDVKNQYRLTFSTRYKKDALKTYLESNINEFNLEYIEHFYNSKRPTIYALILLRKIKNKTQLIKEIIEKYNELKKTNNTLLIKEIENIKFIRQIDSTEDLELLNVCVRGKAFNNELNSIKSKN